MSELGAQPSSISALQSIRQHILPLFLTQQMREPGARRNLSRAQRAKPAHIHAPEDRHALHAKRASTPKIAPRASTAQKARIPKQARPTALYVRAALIQSLVPTTALLVQAAHTRRTAAAPVPTVVSQI